ncbi:hypothetical protein HN446_05345 [bacterium]|nr:hypothetical protein [bacterium]
MRKNFSLLFLLFSFFIPLFSSELPTGNGEDVASIRGIVKKVLPCLQSEKMLRSCPKHVRSLYWAFKVYGSYREEKAELRRDISRLHTLEVMGSHYAEVHEKEAERARGRERRCKFLEMFSDVGMPFGLMGRDFEEAERSASAGVQSDLRRKDFLRGEKDKKQKELERCKKRSDEKFIERLQFGLSRKLVDERVKTAFDSTMDKLGVPVESRPDVVCVDESCATEDNNIQLACCHPSNLIVVRPEMLKSSVGALAVTAGHELTHWAQWLCSDGSFQPLLSGVEGIEVEADRFGLSIAGCHRCSSQFACSRGGIGHPYMPRAEILDIATKQRRMGMVCERHAAKDVGLFTRQFSSFCGSVLRTRCGVGLAKIPRTLL